MSQKVDGELEIMGSYGDSIVPKHVCAKMVGPLAIVRRVLPAFGKPPFQLPVFVPCGKWEED
jgi:hypothetical protein